MAALCAVASALALGGAASAGGNPLTPLAAPSWASAPANDDFANSQAIGGVSGSVSGTTVAATMETGEPDHMTTADHFASGAQHSVWFTWTAPASGRVIFWTEGSSFDPIAAVYATSGAGFASLTAQGANDQRSFWSDESWVNPSYDVTAGTQYLVAVAGKQDDEGTFTLHWVSTSPNDNTAPTFQTSGLADDAVIQGHIQTPITTSATDIAYVQVTANNSAVSNPTFRPIGMDASAPFAVDIDTTILPELEALDVRITAVDTSGNASTVSFKNLRINNTPPLTTLGALILGSTATFSLLSDVDDVFECNLDNAASWTACGADVTYTHLANGPHKFLARAVYLGEVDPTPAEYEWTVDPQAPAISSYSPTHAPVGAKVTLTGSRLTGGVVRIGSLSAPVATTTASSAGSLSFLVPPDTTSAKVYVTTAHGSAVTSDQLWVAPRIVDFSPKIVHIGDTVTVTGTNLDDYPHVLKVGGVNAFFTPDSSTHGTFPASDTSGALSLTSYAGTFTTSAKLLILPLISQLVPDHGLTGITTELSVAAAAGTTGVKFTGFAGGPPSVASPSIKVHAADQRVLAVVPSAAASGPVSVTNSAGATISEDVFTVDAKITGLSPTSGPAGTTLTISGSGFDHTSVVTFSGPGSPTAGPATGSTATSLKVVIPTGATTGPLTVDTAGPSLPATRSGLKVTPKITAVAPLPARVGEPVDVNGTNLDEAPVTLKLGSLLLTVVPDSATHISFLVPAAAVSGKLALTTSQGSFTYGPTIGIRPTIDTVSALSGVPGDKLTIGGKTFTGTTAVKFNGVTASFKVVSSTQLSVTVPSAATTGPLTVTNPGGTTAADGPFVVLPAIASIAPATAYPGTTVTIKGSRLAGASAVTLGSADAASFKVVSPSQIDAVVAPHTATGKVAVTTPSGVATSAATLTIKPFVLRVNLTDPSTDFQYATLTDPALAYYRPSWQFEYATCGKLLNYADTATGSELQPELATALPAVSNDGKTYTFTIRDGLTFSPPSGEAITAQAFKHTIERALNFIGPVRNTFMSDIAGETAFLQGTANGISGIVATGQTLQITLTHAAGPEFLARLSMPFFCTLPASTPMDAVGAPVPSAGPYYVTSYTENGITLARNPNYTGTRTANPDFIQYTLGTESADSVNDIIAGRADYEAGSIDTAAWATATKKAPKQRFLNPGQVLDYIALNTRRSMFSSVAARRAVNLVINRKQLVNQSAADFAVVTDQYLPPGMSGFKDANLFPLNGPSSAQLSQANALAKQAGIQGQTAELYTCNSGSCPGKAKAITADLARIGVKTHITYFSSSEVYSHISYRDEPFDIATTAWLMDYADPFDFLNVLLDGTTIHQYENTNYAYFNDAGFNQKLADAAQLTGSARATGYAALDADIAGNGMPWVAYGNRLTRDFFSARIGCQTMQPVYGMDLAKLCVGNPPASTLSVASFSPVAGSPDDEITFKGTGFLHVRSVRFGSRDADFFVNSDTELVAIVPENVPSGGPVFIADGTTSVPTTIPFTVLGGLERVAFARNGNIWTVNGDRTGLTQLTAGPYDGAPAISPDGTKIVYNHWNPDSHVSSLTVMNADGSNPQVICTTCGGATSWSPDGANLAYVVDGRIWTMNADGTSRTPLTAADDTSYAAPKWSPDGTRIMARHGDRTFLVSVADPTQTTALPLGFAGDDWSPDGTKILYEKGYAGSWTASIMKADLSDSPGLQIADFSKISYVDSMTWGRCARLIVAYSSDLYTMLPSGLHLTQLTQFYHHDSQPSCWSPGGNSAPAPQPRPSGEARARPLLGG